MYTASLTFTAARIAGAIVLDAAALIVWDIGTRSPARLVADLRAGMRDPSARIVGCARFAVGALALLAAVAVSAQVAQRRVDATIVECWALVTALVLEQLVGPVLRARTRKYRDAGKHHGIH